MTDEEKRQFTYMQNDIQQIKLSMNSQELKVDKMYFALMGNEIAKDGGLVGRIQKLENENNQLRDELETVRANAAKSDLYIKWIWALVSAFLTGIFGYVMSLVFKK